MQNSKTKIIAECAILIALGTVLAQIKLYRMPSGGSVTAASMVPFIIIAYRCGTRWGLLASVANVLLQMLLGGIYPPIAPGVLGYAGEILFDYFLAYMVLGLSKSFAKPLLKKNKAAAILVSTLLICVIRFLCAFISGFLIWGSIVSDGIGAVIYSLSYNASYMIPETAITCAAALALYKIYPAAYKL